MWWICVSRPLFYLRIIRTGCRRRRCRLRVIRATVTSQRSVRCVTRLISQAARRQESARENGAFVSKSFSRYFSAERQMSETKSGYDTQFLTNLKRGLQAKNL